MSFYYQIITLLCLWAEIHCVQVTHSEKVANSQRYQEQLNYEEVAIRFKAHHELIYVIDNHLNLGC
jgi:hypothetical protein